MRVRDGLGICIPLISSVFAAHYLGWARVLPLESRFAVQRQLLALIRNRFLLLVAKCSLILCRLHRRLLL